MSSLRPHLHQTGSVWNRYEIGTVKSDVYSGPHWQILYRFSCPIPDGFTHKVISLKTLPLQGGLENVETQHNSG